MNEQLIPYYSTTTASLPGLAVLICATGAFALPLIALIVKDRRIWGLYTLAFSFVAATLSYRLFFAVLKTGKPLIYTFSGWPAPLGIVYEVDVFNGLLGVLVSSIMFLVVLYSLKYMEHEDGLQWYYTLLLGIEAGMLGCLYTGDFFNLFVMIEVTSVSAYALVAFRRYNKIAIEAAMKYAIFGALATTMYFTAIIFAYGSLGTLNMADMVLKIAGFKDMPVTDGPFGIVHYGIALFVVFALWSFTFKAALFPNHFWLPDAHAAAPSSVSAILSGLVVKVGIYAIARFVYTIFFGSGALGDFMNVIFAFLLIAGIASAFLGSILMLVQKDIKRLIAYSTILNIGYIATGLGLGNLLGIVAAIYHIVNHAIAKSALFLSAGTYIHTFKTREIDKLAGVGRLLPVTTFSFAIAAFSLAGVPPLNAFMSKFLLYGAAVGKHPILAVLIVIPSILAFLAYLKIVYVMYLKPLPQEESKYSVKEEALMAAPVFILAIACILIGILTPLIVDHFIMPAAHSLIDARSYVEAMMNVAKHLP